MKIGIIGGALTRRFRELGYEVSVANSRGPETLAELAAETGARAVSVEDAARGNEVVIVTIPQAKVAHLPADLFDGVGHDVVVVDTGNYYPQQRDGRIEGIEGGATESRWVAQTLKRDVVKAFNNIYALHLFGNGKPPGTPGRIALPVAGDDAAAKAVVMRLVDELGFDPVDAGRLNDSWRQQPGSPVYTHDRDANGVRSGLASAQKDRAPAWSGTSASPGSFEKPA
jgi:predicted dinucleotide-binding enzyme